MDEKSWCCRHSWLSSLGGQGRFRTRYQDADFAVFHGEWDAKPTHDQYHGVAERRKDCRYYNCRSRRAFSAVDGEPYPGVRMPWMTSVAWKIIDSMTSSQDRRFRDLDYHLREWYKNISRIANNLLRGHGWQQKQFIRHSDGLSVRWGALRNAIARDNHYQQHPKEARVTSQIMLAALKFGGHDHPRYVIGFECSEYGVSQCDEYDKKGTLIIPGFLGRNRGMPGYL